MGEFPWNLVPKSRPSAPSKAHTGTHRHQKCPWESGHFNRWALGTQGNFDGSWDFLAFRLREKHIGTNRFVFRVQTAKDAGHP